MSELDYSPCRVEGQFVKPCVSLSSAIDGSRVEHQFISELATGKLVRSMVVLKAGDFRKKGVVMNHCPFCGEDISRHVKRREGEEVDAQEKSSG